MQTRIATLLQAFQLLAPQYLGRRFVLTSGDRDCIRQLELSGPNSYHVSGLAFDGVLLPYDARLQKLLGDVAVRLGFRWGGNFKSADVVHFDDGLRGPAGHCAVVSSTNLLGSVAAILAAFIGAGGSPGGPSGSAYVGPSPGRADYGTNQAGGPAFETICGPERDLRGILTGRVTCEPAVFRSEGSDSF